MFYPIVLSCFLATGSCVFTIETPMVPYNGMDKCQSMMQQMLNYTHNEIKLSVEHEKDYTVEGKCVEEKDLPKAARKHLPPRTGA